MRLIFRLSFWIIFLAAAYFAVQAFGWQRLLRTSIVPYCSVPIGYSIGSFDERFGVSREEFRQAIAEAEAVWEDALDKNIFEYHENGGLVIRLVYDDRQRETDVLQNLDISIGDKKESFEELKEKYEISKSQYDIKARVYEKNVAEFESRARAFEDEVERWNQAGGAPPNKARELERERDALEAIKKDLDRERVELNDEANNLNKMVYALNSLARNLNLDINRYNNVGELVGGEFEQGVYESNINGESISIYQFENKKKLVNVLTHELGHALGLDHIDDPKSIMYRLNIGDNQKVTEQDLVELKKTCRNL